MWPLDTRWKHRSCPCASSVSSRDWYESKLQSASSQFRRGHCFSFSVTDTCAQTGLTQQISADGAHVMLFSSHTGSVCSVFLQCEGGGGGGAADGQQAATWASRPPAASWRLDVHRQRSQLPLCLPQRLPSSSSSQCSLSLALFTSESLQAPPPLLLFLYPDLTCVCLTFLTCLCSEASSKHIQFRKHFHHVVSLTTKNDMFYQHCSPLWVT